MYVGVAEDEEDGIRDGLKDMELIPRTLQVLHVADGRRRMSGVWGRPSADEGAAEMDRGLFEGDFATIRSGRGDEVLLDVAVSDWSGLRTLRERLEAARRSRRRSSRASPATSTP